MKKELIVLSSTAILGYGFPISSFEEGMKYKPDVIAADAGSTDPGPYYLGAGYSFTDRTAVKRDLSIMIEAGVKNKIPVIIGTAGGSGGAPHLAEVVEIVKEISAEKQLTFKTAVISAEMNKDTVSKLNSEGKVKPLHPAPELTQQNIDDSKRIVAQMGVEPYIKALEAGADVILAGRSYDPAVFSAVPVWKGYDMGLATHMGKILECACIACTPGSGSDCMLGILGEDYFKVKPLNKIRKATTLSVAAHTLYEKTDPYILPGPGGHLDLTNTKFEQFDQETVKVSGSKFVKSDVYTIKLEGVKCTGYRTVSIAGARDPIFISKIDEIIAGVRERVTDNFKAANFDYQLEFKIYGMNGVMGALEPVKNPTPHELGIVIDCVAPTQEIANTICGFTRSTMLHYGYTDRKATAGNLAFPYSPSDFKVGPVYEFSVYHVMEVENPCSEFPQKMLYLENGEAKEV